jgi:hypothetical protein
MMYGCRARGAGTGTSLFIKGKEGKEREFPCADGLGPES